MQACRAPRASSALLAWLEQSAALGLWDALAHAGRSAHPGNSKPQLGVTFQKKLWEDLAKLEGTSKLPGRTDVSCLREWLLQEQRRSLPAAKKRQR